MPSVHAPHPAASRLQDLFTRFHAPGWMVDELQNRLLLFINHVLMQEPQAQERLKRQQGKPVRVQWSGFHLTVVATPAGLLERLADAPAADLTVTLVQTSPLTLLGTVLAGERPEVDVRGDVQLASEVAWLADNVRWDVEDDLARFVGDAAAHSLGRVARDTVQAIKGLLTRLPQMPKASPTAAYQGPADAPAATGPSAGVANPSGSGSE